jgi:nicotinamidase-related amidase
MANPRMLDREDSVLVVVDVQEGYRNKIVEEERTIRCVRRLIEAAKVMGVPVLVTEQYPKGIGPTQPEIADGFPPDQCVISKMSMSCYRQPQFAEMLNGLHRRQVVLCGIEMHACINQTAHDLIERGYDVHVPYDAASSRFETDYRIGWEKLLGSGAVPATVEMICLEWVRTAEAPEFKAILKLIK